MIVSSFRCYGNDFGLGDTGDINPDNYPHNEEYKRLTNYVVALHDTIARKYEKYNKNKVTTTEKHLKKLDTRYEDKLFSACES